MHTVPGTPAPCVICAAPRDRLQAARGETCLSQSCQTALIHRKKRAEREVFETKCQAIATDFADAQPITDAIPARVPWFGRQLAPLPDEERHAFRKRLRGAFREAFEEAGRGSAVLDEGVEPPASPLTLDASCILCRGYCCRQGAGHAFLEAIALRAIMLRHPSESPASLYRTYCRSIPAESFEQSCLYQGERGCALPRDRRAYICNDFECKDRERLRGALADRPGASTLVIAMEGEAVKAAGLTTDKDGLERIET